jgi:hypothetical protein
MTDDIERDRSGDTVNRGDGPDKDDLSEGDYVSTSCRRTCNGYLAENSDDWCWATIGIILVLKTMTRTKKLFIVSGLIILAFLLLWPLYGARFTTHDDAALALTVWGGHLFAWVEGMAAGQGRFQFLWSAGLGAIAYMVDDYRWYFFVKYSSFILVIALLSTLVARIYSSAQSGYLVALISLTLIQNDWQHNGLTSYPVSFNVFAILFILSVGQFKSALERSSVVRAYLSGFIYFFSIGVELFVLFSPVFFLVWLKHKPNNNSNYEKNKYLILSGVYVYLLVFMVCYIGWRIYHPSHYDGLILRLSNASDIARVLLFYTLNALPIESFGLYGIHSGILGERVYEDVFLSGVAWISVVKALISGLIFSSIVNASDPDGEGGGSNITLASVFALVPFAFAPNLLLSITARHQDWTAGGTHSYLYTYYSFFVIAVILSLAILVLINKLTCKKDSSAKIFSGLLMASFVVVVYKVDRYNQAIAYEQKFASGQWALVDSLLSADEFNAVGEGSIISSHSLLNSTVGYAAVFPTDWAAYVQYKTGKKIVFTDDPCDKQLSCYDMVYKSDGFLGVQYIVFSPSVASSLGESKQHSLLVIAEKKEIPLNLYGEYIYNGVPPSMLVNGQVNYNLSGESFSIKNKYSVVSGDNILFKIRHNLIIHPDSIGLYSGADRGVFSWRTGLSYQIDLSRSDLPDIVDYVNGLSGVEPWGRWSDANLSSDFTIKFRRNLPRNLIIKFSASLFSGVRGDDLEILVGSKRFHINMKQGVNEYRFDVNGLECCVDTIKFIPPGPVSPKELGISEDPRMLSVGFQKIELLVL